MKKWLGLIILGLVMGGQVGAATLTCDCKSYIPIPEAMVDTSTLPPNLSYYDGDLVWSYKDILELGATKFISYYHQGDTPGTYLDLGGYQWLVGDDPLTLMVGVKCKFYGIWDMLWTEYDCSPYIGELK